MALKKIVVLGDSVTAGTSARLDLFHDCFQYGSTRVNTVRESQTWWSILGRILNDWIRDSVEVTHAGEPRSAKEALSRSPEYVLVMSGTKDALEHIDIETFRQKLERTVRTITEGNSTPVLVTPTPISERLTGRERLAGSGKSMDDVRLCQEYLSEIIRVIRNTAGKNPLIDLHRFFLSNRLAYDHLCDGYLPDGVAQSAMASFIAGELLKIMGIEDYPMPVLTDYRKVYSDEEHTKTMHHAFTDITCFQGEFFLAFRVAHSHGDPTSSNLKSNVIKVLRSSDCVTWSEECNLKVEGLDNRDPKFLQVDGKLFVFVPCSTTTAPERKLVSYGFERMGPGKWGEPFTCAPCVFWRPKKWRDRYVVAAYAWQEKDAAVKLLSSSDGKTWEIESNILPFETDGNETDLFVENDKLTAFARAGEGSNEEMLISTYIPGEKRWETLSSGRMIQAPNVFKAGKRTIIIGRYCSQSDDRFRELRKDWSTFNYSGKAEAAGVDPSRVEEYHHGLRTGIFVMDGTRPRLLMELLSAGDSSYTGAVQYGEEFIISDYSMHEHYPPIRKPGDWETPCDIYVSRLSFRLNPSAQ